MIKPYLLLATSYDASMATTAQFTSVRVVCNNTLSAAIGNGEQKVKIPHLSKFNASRSARPTLDCNLRLGRVPAPDPPHGSHTARRPGRRRLLAGRVQVRRGNAGAPEKTRKSKAYKRVLALFDGTAVGSEMVGQSLWGAVNTVTEYVDHERGKARESALDAAWFGEGANLKDRAFTVARELIHV